jgi:hypothetical protein
MTVKQAAIVIREAIHATARTAKLMPSEVHRPCLKNRYQLDARDRAVRLAFRQGVDRYHLAAAFERDPITIKKICKA